VARETAKARRLLRADPRAIFPEFKVVYGPRERHLTPEQLTKLLAALAPNRRRWVIVAVYMGTRRS